MPDTLAPEDDGLAHVVELTPDELAAADAKFDELLDSVDGDPDEAVAQMLRDASPEKRWFLERAMVAFDKAYAALTPDQRMAFDSDKQRFEPLMLVRGGRVVEFHVVLSDPQ